LNAIALLTLNPNLELLDFYKNIPKQKYDLYCFVDNNLVNLTNTHFVNYIQLDDLICEKNGFHRFNPVIKNKKGFPNVSSWDKAIFYFSTVNRSYDNVWYIEDDVFVPDINLFQDIDNNFPKDDLLSSENVINTTGEIDSWVWWKLVKSSNLPLPWAKSMVCALRVSKTLMSLLNEYVSENHNSYKFVEYIFHTLALHNNLSVRPIENLNGIVWRREWLKEELNAKTLYHPIKSIEQQINFRKFLINK
jgi:hypothetical protein